MSYRTEQERLSRVMSPHEIPEQPVPAESPALTMIERAVGALLPHAVCNVFMPFETPLRWHESYMQGEDAPFSFGLWVNLNPERTLTVSFNRTLPNDRQGNDNLWGCAISEDCDPGEDADYSVSGLSITKDGAVEMNTTRRKRDPERPELVGQYVGGEFDRDMSPRRRAALFADMGHIISMAVDQTPYDQVAFCAQHSIDSASRSFDRLAAPITYQTLAPLTAA
jgi:hypothetical protein